MANVLVNRKELEDIADAIRTKKNVTDKYKPREMAPAILSISGEDISEYINDTYNYFGESNSSARFALLIKKLPKLKFTSTGDADYMFFRYQGKELDLSEFVINNRVKKMEYMFAECKMLEKLIGLNNWDTSNARNMSFMFYECGGLKEINIGNWNTSKVTKMSSMFSGCVNLETADVSGFNTSRVTNMAGMFNGAKKLKPDVGSWNVSSVIDMTSMFRDCYSITSLNVSNWNVSLVMNMRTMFENDLALENIDVSNWNLSGITNGNLYNMFVGCSALSNDSLNGILKMCTTATRYAGASNKTLKHLGLTQEQATACQSLSNWADFTSAGWATGY